MSNKRFIGFFEFSTWVKTQLETVTLALTGKLDKSGKALDSSRLDGVTKENLIIEVLATANLDSKLDVTGQAADSAKLGGSNKAAVVSEARTGLVAKSDDFGQYKVGATELSVLLGALASGETLGALQSAFNAFVAAKATDLEATTGTDDTKYLTAKAANAAIQAAVAELVGTAPEALDTIIELSNALQNNPDVIQDLNDMVNTRFSQVRERIDGIDELMLTKASQDQMDTAFGLIDEKAAQSSLDSTADDLMSAINGISSALGSKLDVTGTATNATRLENSTKAQVVAEAVTAANLGSKLDATAQAVDSAKLGGKSLTQVVTDARTGLISKTDDLGQYKVGEIELAALLAGMTSDAAFESLQQNFSEFVAAKASAQEAITGTDNVKYLTALAAKAAINEAVNDLVGAAPEALNTIAELATALENNPNVIESLSDLVATKLNASQVQVIVDTAADALQVQLDSTLAVANGKLGATATATNASKLEGSTKAQVVAEARVGLATQVNLDTKLAANAQAVDSAKLGGKSKAEVVAEAVTAANLGSKLDVAGTAVNASKLEGKTKAQVVAEAVTAANLGGKLDATATAANSSKLEGSTKAQVVTEARVGLVKTTDDFGQYKVGEESLSVLLAGLAAGTDLNALQQSFNAFVAAKASSQEAIAGLNNTKYLTPQGAKAAIDAAVDELVGSAPAAMNTIAELATALENNPDIIASLSDMVATKLNAAQVQSIVDAAKTALEGQIDDVITSVGGKLGATATAANASKLEMSTKAEVIATAIAGAEAALTDDLAAKLDRTAQAADSAKLEGKTKAQVVAEAVIAAEVALENDLATKLDATAQAADSALFQGRTKAQVVAEATAAVQPSIDAKLGATATAVNSAQLQGSSKAQVVAEAVAGSADAIAAKLDKTAQAADSTLLEGKTKAQVLSEARSGLATTVQVAAKLDATATATNASKLEGKTKAQVVAEAIAAANLGSKLDVTARTDFATATQGVKADTAVQPDVLQTALNTKLNASGYTAGDVLAKLLTVDGHNSGLDADALDGKQLATIEAEYKDFTNVAISALVDSSPDTLNTLNELATALGNDPNFATTITNQLASKVDKTDTRLTDAREWSAATITQSEAETGVATTRRAWTAQRVRQAIAAWWTGSADKTKLDGIAAGAQVNVPTNLGYTTSATAGTVTSSTGKNVSLPVATTAAAGLLSAVDKVKLNGISAGATVNSTDTTLLNRSNHTGTQSISTVSGLQTALDSKLGSAAQAADSAKLEGSTKAQVIASARQDLATQASVTSKLDATATAVNSSKLEGSTKAQVVSEAVIAAETALADDLAGKLDTTAKAADSAKLEGKTFSQVSSTILATANLGTASTADIYVSTVDPTDTDGKDGDLWITYTP